jgi:hypothetical protein
VLSGDTGLRKPQTTIRADGPNPLWNAVFTSINELEDISLSPPKRGAMLCGFTDPSLAVLNLLMEAHSLKGDPSFAKDLEAMSDQYVRYLASSANKAFKHAMHSVCPSNPMKAFEALRRSASFAAEWCLEEYDSVLEEYGSVLDLPFIQGMIKAYQDAPKESRHSILALFAPYFPADVTMELFGVSAYEVTAAKLQDANAMAGQTVAKKTFQRMRLGGRTFAFMHQWCRSLFAVTAGDVSSKNRKRLEIRARLHKRYKAMADAEGVRAVKIDCFNKHMKDGFEDEKIESCCCGGCCEGWTALSMLRDFVSDADNQFLVVTVRR